MKQKLLRFSLLSVFVLLFTSGTWATPTTYSFSDIPTKGWSASNGGSQTINGKSWTYSTATYMGATSSRIQVGSSNNPQTTDWTIQTPITSFGTGKVITAVSITAYTTAASATYDISVGGTSVKSGSLTTSSATYSASGLYVTSGSIVVTMKGSSTSKAMYLSNISVTYDDAATDPIISATTNVSVAYNAISGEFSYSIANPVENTSLTATVTAGGSWLSNPIVDAVNGKITFTITENEDEENSREGTIHLVYGDNLATKDVTITQAAAPQKYTVTIESPTGGTLVVKNGDAVVASGSKLAVGTVLTIEATPSENYKYVDWQYKKGEGDWVIKTTNYSYTIDANDVTFKATFAATYPVNWSVNGSVTSTTRFAESETIAFPDAPASINGYSFMGWVASTISGTTDEKPEFLSAPMMGTSELTYYAVFAKEGETGEAIETINQTLAYDTWTYSGTTTDKSSYRLFGNNSYIESNPFDLSKLTKVIVYGGTFGGGDYKNLTIGDGTSTWKSVSVEGSSQTGVNTYTGGTALTGTKALRVTSNSGNGTGNGIRISKIEIFTTYKYAGFCTSLPTETITLSADCTDGSKYYGTYSSTNAFAVPADLTVSEITVIDGEMLVEDYETGAVVPANTGVLVSSATSGNHSVSLGVGGTSVLGEDNMLLASSVAMTGDNLFYRLTMHNGTTIGFWWGAENGAAFSLAANKAYLAVPKAAAARSFWFGGNATDINGIENAELNSGVFYDLSGRRVANPTKGLYIVNGKKVVIK